MKASQTKLSAGRRSVRTLLIDNYDSYTYNLYQLISLVNGAEAIVVGNDISWDALLALDFDNIVISPGPGHPGIASDFGICAEVLLRCEVPLLGVCLGHQGIALSYGGRLARGEEILHGQRSRIFHDESPLFAGLPQGFWAVRYHSLLTVAPVPANLRVTAWTDDGSIMGLAAMDRPIHGVQFHPESVMTEHGLRILENFRDLTLSRAQPAPQAAPLPARASIRAMVERIVGVVDAEGVFAGLRGDPYLAWLDSARRGMDTGRFSYIASARGSLGEIVRYDHSTRTCTVTSGFEEPRALGSCSIFDYLAARHRRFDVVFDPEFRAGLPFGFHGGYVGWIGYECKAACGFPAVHTVPTDDAAFFFADRLVVVDHDCDEVYLLALVPTGRESMAREWLDTTRALVMSLRGSTLANDIPPGGGKRASARPLRSKQRYLQDILRCQDVLARGDSYQICLSNQFLVESEMEPFEAYRRLRRRNPAPYAAYLDFGQTQVVCASPERFLRVLPNGFVESRPMKGTAPRHIDPLRDAQLALALAGDAKETAENLMIVDLLRNDLGRVCTIGSVHVPALMAIESFETVHQMVSTVQGVLRPGNGAVECLRACFPGGSVTGAPKLRSSIVIDEMESGRGIFAGTLGYVGVDGGAEFNIVIRTLVYHGGRVSVGAGGGITILSDGDREWNEVVLKVRSVLNALEADIVES